MRLNKFSIYIEAMFLRLIASSFILQYAIFGGLSNLF